MGAEMAQSRWVWRWGGMMDVEMGWCHEHHEGAAALKLPYSTVPPGVRLQHWGSASPSITLHHKYQQ